MKRPVALSSLLALVALLLFALPAVAQGDQALAEALFQEGQRLMVAKKYDQACDKFADSQRIDPSTGTLLNLASCREAQGKFATAWALYTKAANEARLAGHSDRQAFAQQKINELQPKLSRLTIKLDQSEDRAGVRITLDGEVVSSAALGFPFPVDSGKHLITAKQPGHQDWRAEVTVRGKGASESVTVPVLPVAAGGAAAGAAAAPPSATASPGNAEEIVRLRAELADLKEERDDIGIGGPITMLAIGGGVALVGVIILYATLSVSSSFDEDPDGGAIAVGGVTTAVGAGLALGGGLLLRSRVQQRRALDPDIDKRKKRLKELGVRVGGIGLDPRRGMVVLHGTF